MVYTDAQSPVLPMTAHTKTTSYGLLHMLSRLRKGETVLRVLMNIELSNHTVAGHVVDIGGGRNPNYYQYFKKNTDSLRVEPLDGTISGINFEHDALPYADASVDTVVLCNVLEHIYDYRFLLTEIHRILKPGGKLIGFVPFWMGYHPDPRDYFRYTDECLTRIFKDCGYTDSRVIRVGRGPLIANFNTIIHSLPRVLRPVIFLWYATLDALFVWLRPKSIERNPLGFVFSVGK